MNFRYRLMQFMSGRYGVDRLFYGLFAVSVVLSAVNIFIRSLVLQIIVYAVVIFALYRMLSRNIPARRRENAWFDGVTGSFRRRSEIIRQRRADACHVYRKCPSCRAVLRLPRRPGKHTTVCPKCNTSFTVRVRK